MGFGSHNTHIGMCYNDFVMKLVNIYDLNQNQGFKDCYLVVETTKFGNVNVLYANREYQACLEFLDGFSRDETKTYSILSLRLVKKIVG